MTLLVLLLALRRFLLSSSGGKPHPALVRKAVDRKLKEQVLAETAQEQEETGHPHLNCTRYQAKPSDYGSNKGGRKTLAYQSQDGVICLFSFSRNCKCVVGIIGSQK